MAAVRYFLGAVWSYGVSLPLYVMWSLIVSSARAASDFVYPRGYRPCNELVDAFAEECANRPAGQFVRLSWVNSSATHSLVMNNTGRLLSYVAIASGWFGVAIKNSGTQYQPKLTYRYYYRRSLTGNWFAEIWSVPKSGFFAAALAIPFVDMARDVMRGRTFVKQDSFSIGEGVPLPGYEGLMLLMAGLLLVICFLPRAILGRGTHLAAIAPINGGAFGGYGCAQVINWTAAMAGLSYLWLAMGAEWDVGAVVNFIASGFSAFASEFMASMAEPGPHVLLMIPVVIAAGILFGMAWTVIPAAAFWYVSLRFIAARNAKAQLEALPFNSAQAAMYLGSDFEKLAELRAPQVTLGYLVYIGQMVGIILYPIQTWVRSLF
ncbi:hypothetical protein [Stutzerimonas marianensis]